MSDWRELLHAVIDEGSPWQDYSLSSSACRYCGVTPKFGREQHADDCAWTRAKTALALESDDTRVLSCGCRARMALVAIAYCPTHAAPAPEPEA